MAMVACTSFTCHNPQVAATSRGDVQEEQAEWAGQGAGEGEQASLQGRPDNAAAAAMPRRPLLSHQHPLRRSVTIEGHAYTVSPAVTHRSQLRRGRYEPSEKRLDVLSTGRHILNLYLQNLRDQS